jgi:hypothetical protein
MPSTSEKQHNFMAMSQSAKGRAVLRAHGETPAPASVGKEFIQADKGHSFKTDKVKKK